MSYLPIANDSQVEETAFFLTYKIQNKAPSTRKYLWFNESYAVDEILGSNYKLAHVQNALHQLSKNGVIQYGKLKECPNCSADNFVAVDIDRYMSGEWSIQNGGECNCCGAHLGVDSHLEDVWQVPGVELVSDDEIEYSDSRWLDDIIRFLSVAVLMFITAFIVVGVGLALKPKEISYEKDRPAIEYRTIPNQ